MAHDQLADALPLTGIRTPLIDVHIHLHPPRLFAAIARWFADRTDWVCEHATDPASVSAVLRANGVERFVFCSYAHKTGMARELNAWLAQTSRELGGYGLPLGTVHLDDPDPAGDIATALAAGCIGMKVHEDVQRLSVDDPRFDPVYEEIVAHEGFVLAHIGHVPWSKDTNGGPARVARVLDRHPGLRMVVAHFGVPDWRDYATYMASRPNLFLDTTMAFTPGSSLFAGADRNFIAAHADAIVFGTDYPLIPHAYGTDLQTIAGLDPGAGVLRKIAYANALRLAPALARPAAGA